MEQFKNVKSTTYVILIITTALRNLHSSKGKGKTTEIEQNHRICEQI